MSEKLIISENHILKLILDEFNNNKIGINFMLSDWHGVKTSENDGTLLINRREFRNDRFDIIDSFDENTYQIKRTAFTPMGISSLNATYLSHPNIQEVNYSPQVQFLISADSEVNITANRIAIEEVRARLIQKDFIMVISQFDLNDTKKRINQTIKGVITSGEIDYGDIELINGRSFMYISVELNLFVTNKGEFANQQKFMFGTSEIVDNQGKPIMFEIPLITWNYGTSLDTANTQLIAKYGVDNKRSSEVKSYRTSKAFGLTFTVQIDFDNDFLGYIYDESMEEKLNVPIYYIEMYTMKYNSNKELVRRERGGFKRAFNLEVNSPIGELSLGDKIEHNLTFSPSEKGWFE